MKKLALVLMLLFCCSTAYAQFWRGSGLNQGDIILQKNSIQGHEVSATPSNPPENELKFYICDDSGTTKICTVDSDGSVTVIGQGDLPTTPADSKCLAGRNDAGDSGCYSSFNILSSSINWTSLQEIQSADINWTSVQEIGSNQINWTDIQALGGAGMGGRVNSKEVNINMANPTTGLALVWRNMTGMVYNLTKLFGNATASSSAVLLYATGDVAGGVNWVDVQTIGTLNMDQVSGDVDGVNWTSTKDLGLSDINWTTIDNYGYVAVNWTSGAPTDANIGLQGYLTGAGK